MIRRHLKHICRQSTDPPFGSHRWLNYLVEQGYLMPIESAADAAGPALPPSVSNWPEEWRETFEERAAIIQWDGGLSRQEAELRAETIVRTMHDRQSSRDTQFRIAPY